MKIMGNVKGNLLSIDRLVRTTLTITALSVNAAFAAPVGIAFSDKQLEAVSLAEPGDLDRKTSTVPVDSTQGLETLVKSRGESFGKCRGSALAPFASASVTGLGMGGVGACGFTFDRKIEFTAQVNSITNVKNEGTKSFDFLFGYHIEDIDVGLLAGDGESGMRADVTLFADVRHILADGTDLGKERLFQYDLKVSKPRNNGGATAFDIFQSPDLIADAGLGSPITSGPFGIHYDGFDGEKSLGLFNPGDTVILNYTWLAKTFSGDIPEIGTEAFVGDPFGLSGTGGGFNIVVGDAVPPPPPPPGGSVPEPGTLGILGLGLALSGRASRQRQKLIALE
jgi:PEP-CTERM motif